MREAVTEPRLRAFMHELAATAREPGRVYLTQALAKLERGHRKDLDDVESMVRDRLVDPQRLAALFADVVPELYRYPAVDPPTLRAAVERLASR